MSEEKNQMIGGFWNLENSPVKDTKTVADSLIVVLKEAFPRKPIEFHAFYAKKETLTDRQKKGCKNAGVQVH